MVVARVCDGGVVVVFRETTAACVWWRLRRQVVDVRVKVGLDVPVRRAPVHSCRCEETPLTALRRLPLEEAHLFTAAAVKIRRSQP